MGDSPAGPSVRLFAPASVENDSSDPVRVELWLGTPPPETVVGRVRALREWRAARRNPPLLLTTFDVAPGAAMSVSGFTLTPNARHTLRAYVVDGRGRVVRMVGRLTWTTDA